MKTEMLMWEESFKTKGLSHSDALWASQQASSSLSKEISSSNNNDNVIVNGNDTCRQQLNLTTTQHKLAAIQELKQCNYRTSPRQIEGYLKTIFSSAHGTVEGHWLWIAQHYAPRTINRVIAKMTKQHQRGETTIKNVAAYFTHEIKSRKQRKKFQDREQEEGRNG